MGRLVNNLLDLAKMESGTFGMKFGVVEVEPFIQRVVRKFATMSKEKGVALQADLSHASHTVLRSADEDRLEQVFTNLIDNAFRHTEAGKQIVLAVSEEDEQLVVAIEDQGEGIPVEDLPFVFDRFYKADKARTRGNSVGTGLGLAIVKNIVEAHRGSIEVSSEQGKGTTFRFKIPV
jgi:two-component system sensor histidine kinase ResE